MGRIEIIYQKGLQMSFQESIATVFKKYFIFNGRASRSEYWWFYLFLFLMGVVFTILSNIASSYEVVDLIFNLGVLIPSISVAVRRLHDINKSGWYVLIPLIPLPFFLLLTFIHKIEYVAMIEIILGLGLIALSIYLIYLLAKTGDKGPNKYGEPVISE